MHYLMRHVAHEDLEVEAYFDVTQANRSVFYHGHCQQRSLGLAAPTIDLLRLIGYDVDTSSVECCGMAGSFGYKEDYYEISAALGRQLTGQIANTMGDKPDVIVLASGTSCTEQIHDFSHIQPKHPLVLLESILK
jgi:Fe-S oxidoreductase